MTATVAKDGLTFVMLASLSSAGLIATRTADSFRAEPATPAFGDRLVAAAKWLLELPRRSATMDQLAALSDHELSDIGLARSDLGRVFDRQFAAERNCQRG